MNDADAIMYTLRSLQAKATGLADGAKDAAVIGPPNREPSASFARDYNNLVIRVGEACPALRPILPPQGATSVSTYGSEYSELTYSEIHSHCKQIIEMLGVEIQTILDAPRKEEA